MDNTQNSEAIAALRDIIKGCEMLLPYTGTETAFNHFVREVKRVAVQGLPREQVREVA